MATKNRILNLVAHQGIKDTLISGIDDVFRPRLLTSQLAFNIFGGTYDRNSLKSISEDIYYFSKSEYHNISSHNGALDHFEFERVFGDYELNKPFVCELHDVDLVGPHSIGLTKDRNVILESTMSRREVLDKSLADDLPNIHQYMQKCKMRNYCSKHLDLVCPLTGYYVTWYSQWLMNSLTRIPGLKEYENRTGASRLVLVPSSPPEWIIESLRFFGIEQERIIDWDGEQTNIKKCVIPSNRHIESKTPGYSQIFEYDLSFKFTSSLACNWLRKEAKRRLDDELVNKYRNEKIFISREDADRRRIINRGEIEDYLSQKGYNTYTLSDYRFEEQVAIFNGANTVIGTHGAGFANMIFSENCRFVEIFGDKIKPTYFMLADSLGHEYHAIAGTGEKKDVYCLVLPPSDDGLGRSYCNIPPD